MFIEDVCQVLYVFKIVVYVQGFNQIQVGSVEFGWDIMLGDLVIIWCGGCIIWVKFFNYIKEVFDVSLNLVSLIVVLYFCVLLNW